MRILGNNRIEEAITSAFIYEYQRLFHGVVTGGPFVIGDVVTGVTSGNTGTVVFVDPNNGWIDISLPNDIDFLHPYVGQPIPTVEVFGTAALAKSATSIISVGNSFSGRPPVLHPEFPISNLTNRNRNLITPSKSYQDNLERNFDKLKLIVAFTAPVNMSCIAIVGHNLSPTATVQVHAFNGVTEVYTSSVTNPNRVITDITSQRAKDSGTVRGGADDTNNIFILYFDSSYSVDTIEVDINDSGTTEKYIYVGSLYIGEYWETSTETSYGWSATPVDMSSVIYAQSPYSLERKKYHMLDLILNNLTSVEADDWKYLFTNNGRHKDIIFDTFYSSIDNYEKANTYYCSFNVDNLPITNTYFDRHSLSIQLRESI